MSPQAYYAIGTLLTWIGLVYAARLVWLLIARLLKTPGSMERDFLRSLAISGVVAGLSLIVGSRLAPNPGLQFPLVWPVMPFAAWAGFAFVAMAGVRVAQAFMELAEFRKRERLVGAAGFLGVAALCYVWFRSPGLSKLNELIDSGRLNEFLAHGERKIEIVKGGIPLSWSTAIGIAALLVGTMAVMAITARAVKSRNGAKLVATYLALVAGSVLFSIPFLWLVTTSFKEDQDIVKLQWIPKVTQKVPFKDPENPIYEATFEGTRVETRVIERNGDRLKLDVQKPMGMRGKTFETTLAQVKEVPQEVPLVTGTLKDQKFTGMVIRELEDGNRRVRILEPAALKDSEATFAPNEVENVRDVGLRWQNYTEALDFLPPEARGGLTYLNNTIFLVIMTVIGTLLSSAIVAYAFSRMRFPGRDVLFMVVLSTMMLPGAVTLLPQFLIFRGLGWIDTLLPLWVPAFFGSAFNIFLLRQFFKQIPMELEDAAKIDGCNYLKSFWTVMMPQIKPALVVIAIWTFMGTWNNFMGPLIYISSPENMPIAYALQMYNSDRGGEQGLLMAFTTLAVMPVLIVFFAAQRYFIEGVTLSGLGGR